MRNKQTKAVLSTFAFVLTSLVAGTQVGCSTESTKSPDVADNVRKSLDQANLKDVSVKQDREKGVVTLTGKVPTEADKAQAESLAKAQAGSQVVANEIAVLPVAGEHDAKAVNSDIDKAIGKNLDAALIQNRLHDTVKYDVKNGVVTLTGKVNSEAASEHAKSIAAGIPDVKQVVNELELKNRKATSTK